MARTKGTAIGGIGRTINANAGSADGGRNVQRASIGADKQAGSSCESSEVGQRSIGSQRGSAIRLGDDLLRPSPFPFVGPNYHAVEILFSFQIARYRGITLGRPELRIPAGARVD